MKQNKLTLSSLPHTWIFDIDGTICIHNGYKNGGDILLKGVKDFFNKIPEKDFIIFITSRTEETKKETESFLSKSGIRYNLIIYNAPMGERILINDNKPSGLKTAHALTLIRDSGINHILEIDEKL